jgi:hypothetical protein
LVRDFDSVVLVLFGAVDNRRHDRTVGNRVAAQLVGDQTARHTPLPLQQFAEETLSGTPIAPRLDENVDDVPVLIDRPPEILLPTLDMHEEFVQVPRVAHVSSPSPQSSGILRPEGPAPLANGLVGHGDAPLGQEIFGISETHTEPVVKPNGVTDDRWRKPVAMITGRRADHRPTVPAHPST